MMEVRARDACAGLAFPVVPPLARPTSPHTARTRLSGDRSMSPSRTIHCLATLAGTACLIGMIPLAAGAQRGGGAGASTATDSMMYNYPTTARLASLKEEAAREIDARAKLI